MGFSTEGKQKKVEFKIDELSHFMKSQATGIIEYSYLIDEVRSGHEVCFTGRNGQVFISPVAVNEQSVVVNIITR